MKSALIGTGKMARAFGKYLSERGQPIAGLWGRNPEAAKEAADFVGTEVKVTLNALIETSEVIFLAVSDDAIEDVAKTLVSCGSSLKGKWIGHLSGCKDYKALDVLERCGAKPFSLHPLQTVADPETGVNALREAVLTLDAEDSNRYVLKNWLQELGNPVVQLEPGKKALYHLGACIASNYVMTLMNLALQVFQDVGFEDADAMTALSTLLSGTEQNFRNLGPVSGLTGPVSRGDFKTVESHFESLQGSWHSKQELIRLLTLETVELAVRKDSNNTGYSRIRAYLEGGN